MNLKKNVKIFGKSMPAWMLAVLLAAPAMASVTFYVTGTSSGTVKQAITVWYISSETGSVSHDSTTFTWDMGNVYQGSEYEAVITLKNFGNQPISVKVVTASISATGGNEEFEGIVTYCNEDKTTCGNELTIEVPADGTINFIEVVKIHPAEDTDEQYTITTNVIPSE